MSVDVILEDERWSTLDLERCSQAAFDAVMSHFDLTDAGFECCVLGCDDAKIAELNGDFRDKPQATNVLSWPSEERASEFAGERPDPPEAGELGDIAIAYDTCAREAEAAGKPMADHVTHLVVHALLHLLGYDHVRDQDATLMEATEVAILGKLGVPDPY